ncbi:Carbohydrate sulfotransferase 10-like 5 [Homarus americanus]|uniref:Carbohydrate sulfotransferase n=1 Tax=Homarus americanus TaxID=6706 RepID=A0A8J5N051_HOMAM|nr:Carbohydrate sulfotransferase 10-like 5 [Homarus americanus]
MARMRRSCVTANSKITHCHVAVLLFIATILLYTQSLLQTGKYSITTDGTRRGGNITENMTRNKTRDGREERRVKLASHKPLHEPGISTVNISASTPRNKPYCTVPRVLPRELEARRKRAREACDRLKDELPERWRPMKGTGPATGILNKLRWDHLHHLVYCMVASTTWAWHLLRAVGVKDSVIAAQRNPHILLKELLPSPSVKDYDIGFVDDALNFVVSRHPFHRLVSAYKPKSVKLRRIINSLHHDPSVTIPPFREFCRHVADAVEAWARNPNTAPKPNHHWIPITYMCSPCILNYDIYGKLDTMDSDTKFIADQCGLRHKIDVSVRMNPSTSQDNKTNSTEKTKNDKSTPSDRPTLKSTSF